jgi:hypothetical protein
MLAYVGIIMFILKIGNRMKYKLTLLLAAILMSSNAHASYISSDGDEFTAEFNEHGAVLTSAHEKHYFVGHGANSKLIVRKAIIYLGKDCDVSSQFYGKGVWAWANGGFKLKLSRKELAFRHQDLDIENNGGCRV